MSLSMLKPAQLPIFIRRISLTLVLSLLWSGQSSSIAADWQGFKQSLMGEGRAKVSQMAIDCASPSKVIVKGATSRAAIAQLQAVTGSAGDQVSDEAVVLNDAGVRALERKDFKSAIAKLEAAVKQCPSYKTAVENLGIAYNNFGMQLQSKPFESLKQFHKALYLDPQNATTNGNLEAMIKLMHRNPEQASDRAALGDKATAAGDWCGAVVEYVMALRLKPDEQVSGKLKSARRRLALADGAGNLPSAAYWEEAVRSLPKAGESKPAAAMPSGSTGDAVVDSATSNQEVFLQHAKELYEQYVLASDSHNPGLVNFYAKDATLSMGGSDPHSLTAKLKVPLEQWKERYLSRQRKDGVLNNKDRFENVSYKVERSGVKVSFTRVDPQVTAKVEWFVKPDFDRRWRIFEQTELAVPPAKPRKKS